MKHLVGKQVIFQPTGNLARASSPRYMTGTITKVARAFVTFKLENSGFEHKYRVDGNHLSNGFNSGYYVYATLNEYLEATEIDTLIKEIRKYCSYNHSLAHISIENLRLVVNILNKPKLGEDDVKSS